MRHLKLLAAIAAFIALPAGIYFFFKNRNKKQVQWYTTGTPVHKDLTKYVNASGRLQPQDTITVGSLVAGRVVKLHVDDNDFVKKDQVLVELDDGIGYSAVKQIKAQLLQAKADLDYTKAFYKRQKTLFKAGQLAQDTFESYTKTYKTAKARVLELEAGLEIRQQEYNNLFIKAPEAGVIIGKRVDLGQMITARFQATELFIIAQDLKNMEASISIDETDIGLVKIGQKGIFTVDAYPQKPFKAKVKQINYDYSVVENVITYAVLFDIKNPDLSLRPGMTTNVDLRVAKVKKALCVPNKALRITKSMLEKIAARKGLSVIALPDTIESKLKESVWVMESKKTFKEIAVKLGISDGRFTQIKKGLAPASIIVLEALDPERENPIKLMGKVRA